ncbi:hypothetical protein JGZ01_00060 [Staphylococcus pseudintermedius]|uniref:hypothetical protein n=1 Tax=Staphylococcus pseudintermedius TaxID=283734 RepID=UPI0018F2CA91|nr:hypothetical protein [Staphylococcus pseudintermedius]MBJ8272598.1 hypothetical protein [Staphylococcus pseudintermedius]
MNADDGSSNSAFDNDDNAKRYKRARDFIKFIINPYSENTKVYNGSFLTSSGDIDYSKVIAQTSTDSAIKSKENEKEKHESNLKNLEIQVKKNMKNALKMNVNIANRRKR